MRREETDVMCLMSCRFREIGSETAGSRPWAFQPTTKWVGQLYRSYAKSCRLRRPPGSFLFSRLFHLLRVAGRQGPVSYCFCTTAIIIPLIFFLSFSPMQSVPYVCLFQHVCLLCPLSISFCSEKHIPVHFLFVILFFLLSVRDIGLFALCIR